MKLKRFAALGLTLALTLTLVPVGAHAAGSGFTDIDTHWAKPYIEEMYEKGLAVGYEQKDAEGNSLGYIFRPEGIMTAAETLLFCSRSTGIPAAVQDKIAKDHEDEVRKVLPESIAAWKSNPSKEIAVAIEAGVLSLDELAELSGAGALSGSITREEICKYLVRAMQLEPLAKSLKTYTLRYTDKDEIAEELKPYVYVLTNYGITQGVGNDIFQPKGPVTRAQMTTMLSRTLKAMSERGIAVELANYTDYDWQGGVITAVSESRDGSVILTLKSEISGTRSYTVPAGADIYRDNMLGSVDDLKVNQYARLNFSTSKKVSQVRLGGAVSTYSGSVSSMADSQLSVLVNGVTRNFTVDRFTEVSVGGTAGDRKLIDPEAGYTGAECYVDGMGHLAGVKFSGGSQSKAALVESVTTNGAGATTLTVKDFSGVSYSYAVPDGIAVLIDDDLGTISAAKPGHYVELQVGIDSDELYGLSVDTTSPYIQGPIVNTGTIGTGKSITLRNTFTGKDETYTIGSGAAITYNGQVKTAEDVTKGWYATVRPLGNVCTEISGYPGSFTVEGTLTSIIYGATTQLQITRDGGSTMTYSLDINKLPEITRGGKTSAIDKLVTGDTVVVTLRYNEITQIDATARNANLTGTITAINMTGSGITMTVTHTDGTTASYAVGEGVSVTQNGAPSNIYSLKPKYTVALVTNGDTVVSIDVTSVASSATQLTGTVYYVTNSSSAKALSVLVTDSVGNTSTVTVNVKNAILTNAATGATLTLNGFANGDSIVAYGSYDGATFVATIVVKQ